MKLIKPSEMFSYVRIESTWVVEGLLRLNRKRVSLLCGAPHAGKSTLARQLALAVAHGDPFLGRETTQSKVLYWQSEETEEDAKDDFTKSGMQSTDDSNLVIMHPTSTKGSDNLRDLSTVLEKDKAIKLVIIETLDDFLKMDDLSDNPSARRAFEKFDSEVVAIHQNRCAFLVLHHFKKSDEQRGSSLSQILGATVIAGKTDAKIYIRQVSDTDTRHYIKAQVRKGIDIEPTYLTFDGKTQASTLGVTLADEKAEAKKVTISVNAHDLRSRCVSAVMENPGLSKTACANAVGGKTEKTFEMFKTLIADGTIVNCKGGLYIKGAEQLEEIPA